MGSGLSRSSQTSSVRRSHRNKPARDIYPEKRTSTAQGQRTVEGRIYHSEQDSNYPLPMDDREIDRLHEEHFLTKELLGCNIMREATKRLDFQGGELHILDACCGPATWLCQTSLEYPNCHFSGVDMSTMWPQIIRPVNLSFTRANVLHGLPYPDQYFDFVQLRFVALAFKSDEWTRVILEIKRVLKDGGMFQCIDLDMTISKGGSDIYSATSEETKVHPEDEFSRKKDTVASLLHDIKTEVSKFDKFCVLKGLDKASGAKIDMMLSDARMTILQSEYREIPLGWGGLIGDAYYNVYEATLEGIAPLMRQSFDNPSSPEPSAVCAPKKDMMNTKSFIGLYAFLAQKPLDD
ncbi:S-adenosyl-L-methionine-dependent methyltransferase [Phycomyces blakesleeanus]